MLLQLKKERNERSCGNTPPWHCCFPSFQEKRRLTLQGSRSCFNHRILSSWDIAKFMITTTTLSPLRDTRLFFIKVKVRSGFHQTFQVVWNTHQTTRTLPVSHWVLYSTPPPLFTMSMGTNNANADAENDQGDIRTKKDSFGRSPPSTALPVDILPTKDPLVPSTSPLPVEGQHSESDISKSSTKFNADTGEDTQYNPTITAKSHATMVVSLYADVESSGRKTTTSNRLNIRSHTKTVCTKIQVEKAIWRSRR